MLRRTLVHDHCIDCNEHFAFIPLRYGVPTILLIQEIDVTKIYFHDRHHIMIGAPVAYLSPRSLLTISPDGYLFVVAYQAIAVVGYFYSIQTEEWAILVLWTIMISFSVCACFCLGGLRSRIMAHAP